MEDLRIFKYEIPLAPWSYGKFEIRMPHLKRVLTVQIQLEPNGAERAYLWAIVDAGTPDHDDYKFQVIGTGHRLLSIPADREYIGTYQIRQFVWHLFYGWRD